MWNSLSIIQKVWVSIGLLIIGYFVSTIFGFIGGKETESKLNDVSEYLFPATKESQLALSSFNDQIKLYNDAVMMGDETLVDAAKEKSEKAASHLGNIINLTRLNEESLKKVGKTSKLLEEFTLSAQQVYKIMSSDSETDVGKRSAILAKQTDTLQKDLNSYTKLFSDDLKSELSNVSSATKNQRWLNLIAFFLVVSVAIAFNLFIISRSISRPLNNTVLMIKDIAEGEGDLTKRLEVKNQDEVGKLSSWLNTFLETLQKMIQDIATNAETLSTSSAELSDLSGLMTEGADQMSSKSNTVSTSAHEMDSAMESAASSMEQASTNTGMVATSVEEMTATINEIAQNSGKAAAITNDAVTQAGNASTKVEELGRAAQEIGKVTETITDISSQTNLLALNATIEAARAGEAGKGFAVVANEIKELASQTAEATKDIKLRVEGIQGSAVGTVTAIEEISKIINSVNEITSTIATAVEEQSVTTKEIAGNVVHVSGGIEEVNKSVSHSNKVAGQIAGDIAEVSQAAGEMSNSSSQVNMSAEKLSALADELKGMMKKFKV